MLGPGREVERRYWFDAQEASVACFVGEEQAAREIIERACELRLADSLDAKGHQPHELERTKSLHYSLFSLEAWFVLARLGERVGVDVWGAETQDGVGLREALRYPTSYLDHQEDWPHPMLTNYQLSDGADGVLRLAAARWADESFLRAIRSAPKKPDGRRFAALFFSTAAPSRTTTK